MKQQDLAVAAATAQAGPGIVGLYSQLSEKSQTYLARLARDLLDQEREVAGRIAFRPKGLRLVVGSVAS